MWRAEGGDQGSDVDGEDGDDDTRQEDGGQLVDIFHAHKDQQTHQEKTDGAVDTHVVQQGRPFAVGLARDKDGCPGCDVHLEEEGQRDEKGGRGGESTESNGEEEEEEEGTTHQKDLDGSQDVHGPGEGGAQVEAQAHRAPKLWTQRTTDHEVGAPRWIWRGRERESDEERERERGKMYIRVGGNENVQA